MASRHTTQFKSKFTQKLQLQKYGETLLNIQTGQTTHENEILQASNLMQGPNKTPLFPSSLGTEKSPISLNLLNEQHVLLNCSKINVLITNALELL